LRLRDRPKSGDIVREWLLDIDNSSVKTEARNLYCGRGFKEALKSAGQQFAVQIISVGLGLIRSSDMVPAYEATVTPGADDDVRSLGFTPHDWWTALSVHGRVKWPKDGLLLIAASAPYLDLINRDLIAVPSERVRLFTRASPTDVSPQLRSAIMPYDDRLNDPRLNCAGTFSDFAQRAMAHFANTILIESPSGTTDDHRRIVAEALSQCVAPIRTLGRSAEDREVMELIACHFESVGGRAGPMLRLFRDELRVACEQSRFSRLFRQFLEETWKEN
jgi:hypothetical protein